MTTQALTEQQLRDKIKSRLVDGTMTQDQARQAVEAFRAQQQVVQPTPTQQSPAQQSFIERFRAKGAELDDVGQTKELPIAAQQGIASAVQSVHPTLGKIVTGITGLGRRTDETSQAQELIDAPISDVGAKLGFHLATNFDNNEIEQVIAKEFGEQSIRKDEQGNTFVNVGGTEYILNKPGLSKQDLGATIGNILAFLPASRAAALGQTVGRRLGIAAATSGATQGTIEGVQAATGGDFGAEDIQEIGLATALGPLGELSSAIQQTRRLTGGAANLLPDVTDAQAAQAALLKEQSGVSLIPSQASQTQKDELVSVLLFRDPATTKAFGERLSSQSKEVFDGAFDMLDELASSDEAARAALDVQNTAKGAVEAARAERTAKTSPMFNKVWKESNADKVMLDTSGIVDSIDTIAKDALGSATIKEANDIKEMIKRASRSVDGTNVKRLHDLKRALFQKRDSLKARNNGFLDDEIKDLYDNSWAMVREKLVSEADGYAEANDLFRELSPAFEKVEGNLGNITNVSDDKLNQISKSIFNLDEFIANPARFDNTKQLIQNANSDAWQALVRSRFQQDLAEIGLESADEALDPNFNYINALWQKSFRGKEKTLFKSALDGDMKRNYEAMADVFNKTRKRPSQSATVQLNKLDSDLSGQGGVANAIKAIENRNAAGVFSKLFDTPQVREKNLRIIADIITDPKWMHRMSEIRKLGMETPKGGAAFMQLFKDALNESEPKE